MEFLKKQKFKYKNEEFYFSNNNITKAIVEFAEAYPDYAQYLIEAPSFKKFVNGGCHEKISDWESKEHKYNIASKK